MKIILASRSPRRKMLLEWAALPFVVQTEETDETFPAGLPVETVPAFIARNKAYAVAARMEMPGDTVVIGADTVVVLGEEIIGKPSGRAAALDTLARLSGRVHRVMTGVVLYDGRREIAFTEITEVEFYPLNSDQIAFYVDRYQPFDKAGGYAIQEWIGVTGIKRIDGDFYNVMGLPVSRVVKALREFE